MRRRPISYASLERFVQAISLPADLRCHRHAQYLGMSNANRMM